MRPKQVRLICFIIAALVPVLALVLFFSGFFSFSGEKVLPGVSVMGYDLGGLTRAEGVAVLSDLEKNLRAQRITLRCGGYSRPLVLSEAGFELNEESIVEAALKAGRSGSLIKRWEDRRQFKKTGVALGLQASFDRERLSRKVRELFAEVIVEPKDARFEIRGDDTVAIVPGSEGFAPDIERLEKDILNALTENKREVALHLVRVPPGRTAPELESMGVNSLLASYTTTFDPSMAGRTYNIKVAARAFDELLVQPGQDVSFNRVVGPRSFEAGYRTAPVIVNNEFVDGLGGGVCQVSTTLYNCVLLANLEIVERICHSLPVSYVPIGRDATVVYDAIDFIFRNNTDSYLLIKTYVSASQVTFKIFGNGSFKRDVSIYSWITEEIEPPVVYKEDPNLPRGEQVVVQEGSKGFRAAAVRVVSKNGTVEKRETLPFSEYSPVKRVIAVGVGEPVKPQLAPPAKSGDKPSNPLTPAPGTTPGIPINQPSYERSIGGENPVLRRE